MGLDTTVGIKICGLRREIDAEYVNEFERIKYIGLVFAKSKRRIAAEEAIKIKKKLRPDIKAAGVFADMRAKEVIELAKKTELDIIQLHSNEDMEFIETVKAQTGLKVWKSISVKDDESIVTEDISNADGFILDAYTESAIRGGHGKSFNWNLAKGFARNHFTVLAGGINEDNIIDAYRSVRPNAIDLSSSVETDGFKDYKKIESLIRRIQ